MEKYVYFFGEGHAEGDESMTGLLGGKGAGLAGMTRAGLPVPPGFTISTAACGLIEPSEERLPKVIEKEVAGALRSLEKITGHELGAEAKPLLLSLRSGAKFSMPGMMDTILNLGMNPEIAEAVARWAGDVRFAWDSYRRFVQMFGEVVLSVPKERFEQIWEQVLGDEGTQDDTGLSTEALQSVVGRFKAMVRQESGTDFPDDPHTQLRLAIHAIFRSWNNPRAAHYRKMNSIPEDLGTAVTVQAMVFGNLGDTSASGVGFTRNPSTGVKEFYGEFLMNAPGEDVVSGIRTPKPIEELATVMPEVYDALKDATTRLEQHYRDVQDFEFTVQEGRLFLLQTRNGKRTGPAAVRIAVDMVEEGLIDEAEAVQRVDTQQLEQTLHPRLDPSAACVVLAHGLPASPGAGTGKIVFTAEAAVERSQIEDVILVRTETSADDIHGMAAAKGVLTERGGMTSHAAVVARGMGKCCIVGASEIEIDEGAKLLKVGNRQFEEGDDITLDGTSGQIIEGRVAMVLPDPAIGEFAKFLAMADRFSRLQIRGNADTPEDAARARSFGAQGIGLCRTEHMFFSEDRLPIVQEMILAESDEKRRAALDRLLPFQRDDFEGLFRAMSPLPVTVRLLDPPLHEFLPRRESLMVELALLRERRADPQEIEQKGALLKRVEDLYEFNPMMGHRGCRLGITYPEITEMQVRAIIEAACVLVSEGVSVMPEIMIPLVGLPEELSEQRKIVDQVSGAVLEENGVDLSYSVGTMIELPRAAMVAEKIAASAEFFSFGTNDLTQMTFGYSRDDAGKFLRDYLERGILTDDPFKTLDQDGVGELVRLACEKGRKARPQLELGICGEHGGDPASIEFFHRVGLDYVSCSPYRIPMARLAAAQAALGESGERDRTV
jgi:pyruvate,orthophosphate dikinase